MCVVNMAINKGPEANLNEQMSPCFITTKLKHFLLEISVVLHAVTDAK